MKKYYNRFLLQIVGVLPPSPADAVVVVITNDRRECGDLIMLPQRHEMATPLRRCRDLRPSSKFRSSMVDFYVDFDDN